MAAPRWLACSTKNARAWAVYESAAISSPAENEIIHLVNSKGKDIGPASHSVKVMVLSLLLGKTMCLSEEEMKCLGMGALLHDAGKSEVPQRILLADNRTKPKEDFYRGHVPFGIKVVAGIREIGVPVRNIIACQHEHWDGSGYPTSYSPKRSRNWPG